MNFFPMPQKRVYSAPMNTPLLDFVIDRLQSTKGSWPSVADGSGVPRRTLEKIARKEIPNPGIKHVEALAEYFRKAA